MSNVAVKQENQSDWQFLPIKDFAHTTSGGTPKRGVANYYNGNVPWVKSGDLNDGHLNSVDEFITELGLKESSAKLFKPGTVLIALYGATIGRLSILNFEAATNQAVCGISVPEYVDVKYLFYYLRSIRQKLIDQGKGGAQPNINQQIVKETVVPLAPPEQQKRIVAKIEELFSHIDAGIEALKKAKQLLKQYRQSVLKAAVTGELTEQWRADRAAELDAQGSANAVGGRKPGTATKETAQELLERILKERRQKWEEQQLEQFKVKGKMPKDDRWKEKYIEPEVIEPQEIGVLPEGWKVIMLSGLCTQIGDVDHKMPKAKESGIPYISTKDFTDDGDINFESTKLISKEDFDHLCRKIYPENGDILLSRYGTVGEVRRVNTTQRFQASYSIAIIKPASDEIGKYLSFALMTEPLQRQIKKHTRATAQPDLGLAHIREFEIPLPSKEEQEEIMKIVDDKLNSIMRLESDINHQLLKAERNKQSVLASAFSGGLAYEI